MESRHDKAVSEVIIGTRTWFVSSKQQWEVLSVEGEESQG